MDIIIYSEKRNKRKAAFDIDKCFAHRENNFRKGIYVIFKLFSNWQSCQSLNCPYIQDISYLHKFL